MKQRTLLSRQRQRGIVIVYALVGIILIMLASIALIRGLNTSTAMAGAAGMRHDLMNQGDRGIACALATFGSTTDACPLAVTGLLSGTGAALRVADDAGANYHATALQTNSSGIPLQLLANDATFTANNGAGDITDATYQVSIRYVIDRLCNQVGAPNATNCVANNRTGDKGGTNWLPKAGTTFQPVYRVTVRVTGPKNSMTFVQMMIGA